MIIKYEIEPIDFLRDDSWECDDLYDDIVNSNKEDEFNALIEDIFPNGATQTELNDYWIWQNDVTYCFSIICV